LLKLVVIGTIAAFIKAEFPVTQEIVNEIRSANAMWQPLDVAENPFASYSMEQIKALLGTVVQGPAGFPPVQIVDAPASFDSRTQWPGCVHSIRDQQQCGSCWAFAASEAFSDRICIATGGKVNVVISPQDMVSCDKSNFACDGGYLDKAWQYLQHTGAATDACEPYVSGGGSVPACPSKCKDGSAMKKYKCKNVQEADGPAQIKSLIQASGPVETGFTVYSDFFNYRSGIYHHISGGVQGGHAVKIIGWGVQGSTKYWICANSWGTGWGESGYFKIQEGDCGIDQAAFGCIPNVSAQGEYVFQ
jgi:cathepsin B